MLEILLLERQLELGVEVIGSRGSYHFETFPGDGNKKKMHTDTNGFIEKIFELKAEYMKHVDEKYLE